MKIIVLSIVLAVLTCALSVGVAPALASGGCVDWNDLMVTISVMLDGAAETDLLAATSDIQYQEFNGTDEDIADAYDSWGEVLNAHIEAENITELEADTLNHCFLDASQIHRLAATGIWGVKGKKCNSSAQCTLEGTRCWSWETENYWGCAYIP